LIETDPTFDRRIATTNQSNLFSKALEKMKLSEILTVSSKIGVRREMKSIVLISNMEPPRHTRLLATASGFSDNYQHINDEVTFSDSSQGGSKSPLVRADMTYLEYPNGGAVFSVSSIAWCGCLYFNGYKNNVSKIMENVLSKFAYEK